MTRGVWSPHAAEPPGAGRLLAGVVLLPTAFGLVLASSLFYYEIAVQYFLILALLYLALHGIQGERPAPRRVERWRLRTPRLLRWIWGSTDRLRAEMRTPQDSGRLPWRPIARIMLSSLALGWAMTLVVGLLLGHPWGVIVWREILECVFDVVVFAPMLFAVTTLFVDSAATSGQGPAATDAAMDAPGAGGWTRAEHDLSPDPGNAGTCVTIPPRGFRHFLWLGMVFCGIGLMLGIRIWAGPLMPHEQPVRAAIRAIATGPWAR